MLLKNVLKTLQRKWMQLTAIGVIVISSSFIYTMMFYGMSGIAEPTLKYLSQSVQEDFSAEMLSMVTAEESQFPILQDLLAKGIYTLSDIKKNEPATFQKLMDNRIGEFEKVYTDSSLELREYKTLDFDYRGRVNKALIAKDAERINLSYMEEGVKPARDNEIALNKIYADKNSLKIGDPFIIKNKQYRITGFVLFPDYTLPTFDNSFNVDTGLQCLVLMIDSEYEDLDAKEAFRLAGINLTDEKINTAYDKDKLPFVNQIIPTSASMRSGAVYDELTQGRVSSLGLSIFIATIAVIIVSIMMSNLLHSERGQIGILKAMGYRRLEIAMPYFLSVVIMALIMLIVGYIAGYFYAEPLKMMYLDFYLLPQVKISQSITVFATAIFVPLFFFALFSGLVIYRMLGERALNLLRPHETTSLNRLSKYLSRLLAKAKGKTKFKYLHAIRSTGSFAIFFIGIMFSTILITFSFMMTDMFNMMTVGYLNKVDYKYQAYADFTKRVPEPRAGEEKFLIYPYAYIGDRVITLEGLSPDNKLYNLIDPSGKNLTKYIRNDSVITGQLGLRLGIDAGDTIKVKVGTDYYDFVVRGMTDDYTADQIYLNISRLSNIISDNKSSRLYSGIYSTYEPSSEYYSIIISKAGIIELSRAMSNYMDFMINFLILGSAVIAASILFVLTSFTVEKNYYAISLLKVLGYRRREVNSMILDSYFVYALLSYFASIPIAIAILNWVMDLFLKEYGVIILLQYRPEYMLQGLVILIAIFFTGTYIGRRRIGKIPLQEVLKTYSE
ncbi:MAG: ABC transporter permease [Clostridiaceae bacterium]